MITIPIVSLVTLLILSSCNSSKTWRITPAYSQILTPELNVTVVSELGDTLVDQGHRTTRDTIVTKEDIKATHNGVDVFLGKGSYVAERQDENFKYFHPIDAKTKAVTILGQDTVKDRVSTVGYAISKSDNSISAFDDGVLGIMIAEFENDIPPNYFSKQIQSRSASSFRQQLIYNGRVDNNLRFIYREFSNDIARGSFTQEMQYDLGESKIIGFKGVRIEVKKASNTQIEYKVLSHFRGEQF